MADPLDVLDLTEAKAALEISGDTHDTKLAQFVTGVSRRLDDACGPIVIRTVTDETHNPDGHTVWLRHTPVASVTTVIENLGTTATTLTAETAATKPASGYLLLGNGHDARLYRRASGSFINYADDPFGVVVTYQAGRYANTAAVDAKFKLAAAIMLEHLWKPTAGAWAQTADPFSDPSLLSGPGVAWRLPPSVMDLLADELRPPVIA